ncbi:hypothetical protein J4P02_22640 [Pseudomonas sp. NFXW11]|uniref:hypothetical protein n=1 Tax=Pseudomonas sp. NFXW11 TaxID=2819531 RepID=UPI003CE8E598
MKRSLKKLLKKIYASNSMTAMELVKHIEGETGDHRDFYPVVALVDAGYLGFTGPQPNPDEPFRETIIAKTLQCYRQGPGHQSYENVTILGDGDHEGTYFYIGPKCIEFFEARWSDTKRLLTSAGLSFVAAVTVALLSYFLKST